VFGDNLEVGSNLEWQAEPLSTSALAAHQQDLRSTAAAAAARTAGQGRKGDPKVVDPV